MINFSKATILGFVLLVLTSCSASFQTIPGDINIAHSPACQKLDGRRRTAGTIAAAAIATGLASSAAAALLAKDHPETAMGVSVGGMFLGGVTAGATWYETDAAGTYRDICLQGATVPAATVVPK